MSNVQCSIVGSFNPFKSDKFVQAVQVYFVVVSYIYPIPTRIVPITPPMNFGYWSLLSALLFG